MIDSLANTQIAQYDDFNRTKVRRIVRRKSRRRRPPVRFTNSGFPIQVKVPTKKQPKIVKGRPTKLPPITNFRKSKNTGVVKPGMLVKNIPNKKATVVASKKKIAIDKLIKKTAIPSKVQGNDTMVSKQSSLTQGQEKQAVKKAQQSDARVSKIVKIVAGVGIIALAGFGIYKYVQHQKKVKVKLKKSA
ncbi:hypothetical protein U8527_07210 [Kordia algicida OT-1]|uniref:Uncharacterized protein n=1 Tax=Kordia algicida OT-1 TaxID=391587 RepID=A9EA40_9FLAO|nr:hypothetical protein [Kordia algicida]EDP94733.1 hypothetical protein KAOT1_00615 [Kordia algicida OT-1]